MGSSNLACGRHRISFSPAATYLANRSQIKTSKKHRLATEHEDARGYKCTKPFAHAIYWVPAALQKLNS